jgi:hypothetical protein
MTMMKRINALCITVCLGGASNTNKPYAKSRNGVESMTEQLIKETSTGISLGVNNDYIK